MLQITDLTYRIAGRTLFEGASADIPDGHKIGVVGPNGTGKSTLLKLITGDLEPDAGSISLPRGSRIGAVAQEAPGGSTSLIDYVLSLDEHRVALEAQANSDDPHQIAEAHQRLADIEAHKAPARAAIILAGLGFDEAAQQRPLQSFSGGWRMRVALAGLLFLEPDLLLLDEPTNYLDLEGTIWLESFLRRYPHTVLVVSHDRALLNGPVDGILHVHAGKLAFYRGNYDQFEERRRMHQAQLESMRSKQEAERAHLQAFVDRFRYKASKARQAQSKLKALARLQPIAAAIEDPNVTFRFPQPEALRPPLLAADHVSVGYAAGQPVLRGLDFRIDQDDRIALLGRNGNGKSTLAKLLAGRLEPMSGELQRHRQLSVGFFAQHQIEDLNPADTALSHLSRQMKGAREPEVRARLASFGLGPEKANVKVENLSGGERARLVLATLSIKAPSLLILDEPTNHLDIDARQALIQAIAEYQGAVVLITHDTHVIELVADRLWLVDEGTVKTWEGDVADYRQFLLGGRRAETQGQASPESKLSQKERRQQAAAQREAMAPLRKAIQKAEREMARLGKELEKVEADLADGSLYAGQPDRLVAMNQRRAELQNAMASEEESWLEATEKLERAEAS